VNTRSDTRLESAREASLKVYEQICQNIRVTDEISFKLLGLVPLISSSGAAILSVAQKRDFIGDIAVASVSIAAAVITFGLFKWELRNIQKCNWLIVKAAELEETWFCGAMVDDAVHSSRHVNAAHGHIHQFNGWLVQQAPPLFGRSRRGLPELTRWWAQRVGKEKAERMIYWSCIAAWSVPIIVVTAENVDLRRLGYAIDWLVSRIGA